MYCIWYTQVFIAIVVVAFLFPLKNSRDYLGIHVCSHKQVSAVYEWRMYVDGCTMKSIEIISTYVLYNTYSVVMYIMQWYEIEEKTFSRVFF